MAEILTLGLVSQGYCSQCETPATVGALHIKGWDFEPHVCGDCLTKLVKRLEARAEQSVEPEGAKKK